MTRLRMFAPMTAMMASATIRLGRDRKMSQVRMMMLSTAFLDV